MTDLQALGRPALLRSQAERLTKDVRSRFLGGTLAYLIFGAFLPGPLVGLGFAGYCLSEYMTSVSLRNLCVAYSTRQYLLLMFVSTLGVANYALMPAILWTFADPVAKFVAIVAIAGAMLTTAVVRSLYLPMAFWNLAPAALVFLWMPVEATRQVGWSMGGFVAIAAALVFVAYLLSVAVLFNRTEAQMLLARETSDRSAAALARLFSALSHELRTPLHVILGLVSLRSGQPTAHDADRELSEQAKRALQLVDDALEMAPASASTAAFATTTDLKRTLSDVLTRVASQQPRHVGAPELKIAAEVPAYVRLDADHLRRALRHLCLWLQSQGTPEGSLVLDCTLAPGPEARLDLILSTLMRAASGASAPAPQETLSLQIATHAIAALSGVVTTGTVEGGLRAQVLVPFAPLPAAPLHLHRSPVVLIVDDIATNRLIIAHMLRSSKITAEEATSGAEALARLSQSAIDLVLLDMNMPGMDGAATLGAIRALPGAGRNVKVIALTADSTTEHRHRSQRLDLADFLTKPLDAQLLTAAIRAALCQR